MARLDLHVCYDVSRRGVPAPASFRRCVEATLKTTGCRKPVELSIRIVGAREGHALNWRYRGKDHATNVLSFPAEVPKGVKTPLLGDIVICAPIVVAAARKLKLPARNHYAHLTTHGVLHLLGYDHQNEKDFARMSAMEVRTLASLGIADPYNT